ncbi:MAG: hypothetical protein KGJ13_05630 [Patescibacteria group bacterium]|nr:hypothetical protein [Patescibacteria group bacterium]
MKQGNKIAIIVVLGLVVLFGLGQFFTTPVAPVSQSPAANSQQPINNAPAPTQVLAYEPPVLASGPRVESGSCWTNSIAAPYRKDAWRCAVGNGISDPCFEIPNNTNLICGVNPQNPDTAFILQLTKPLPAPEVPQGPAPTNWGWLVELQGGTLCSPFTGTLPFASDGESASYGCAPGPLGKDIMIFGDLNASSSVWTAKIGTLSTSTKAFPPKLENAQTVPVISVWQ